MSGTTASSAPSKAKLKNTHAFWPGILPKHPTCFQRPGMNVRTHQAGDVRKKHTNHVAGRVPMGTNGIYSTTVQSSASTSV